MRAEKGISNAMLSLRPLIGLLAALLLLVPSACVTEPGSNRETFAELDGAGRDLQAALAAGDRCGVPDELVQHLAAAAEALQSKVASRNEKDLLAAYTRLAVIAQDGQLLCRRRTHLTGFPFVPKGRIYVSQELDAIVVRYHLPEERHRYAPTGEYWKSVPVGSIDLVWEKAIALLKEIEVMMKYG